MDGREIPGYYFDKAKKRYFKIEKSRHAPRPDSKYTQDNIRETQKREKTEKDAATLVRKRQKQTIVRRLARHPLTQALLDREVDVQGSACRMRNAWPDACVAGLPDRPRAVFRQPYRSEIRLFDRDPATKTVYAVHGDNMIKRRRLNTSHSAPLPQVEYADESGDFDDHAPLNEYTFNEWDELARLTSSISSLNFLPASGALAATTYGSDRPPVVYLSDPDNDGPYVNQQFTPKNTSTIWGAAVRPASLSPPSQISSSSIAAADTESFAVATSSALLLFTRSPTGTWDSSTVLQTDTDVVAVDWLSHQVVALGCRDGKIRLYDTRSRGSSHILTHSSRILQLRRADDPTRLICAGLQDSLLLYDIRSAPRSHTMLHDNSRDGQDHSRNLHSRPSGRNKRRKRSQITLTESSQPVLSFQHACCNDMSLAMDVSPRLGLLAAAQDQWAAIKIYNMWTGKMIKEVGPNQADLTVDGRNVRCLKFMDSDDNGDLELWAGWAGGIGRFRS